MTRLKKSDFILESKIAELNQNKKPKYQLKLGNTVAYPNRQLFISAPQNYCTNKSVGKFPKKIAHARFLQCSAYIVLSQDNDLGKINLKHLWNHRVRKIRQSMVNMSVSCPLTFSLGSHNSKVLPLVTRGLHSHVLKSIHKICLNST